MNVHVLIDRVIRRCPVPNVRVRNEPNGFQNFESPVDRRQVDTRCRVLDLHQDFLRRSMTQVFHRLQDKLALRRDAKTVFA